MQSFPDLSRRSACLFLLRRHGIFAPPLETMMTSFSTTVFHLDARRQHIISHFKARSVHKKFAIFEWVASLGS